MVASEKFRFSCSKHVVQVPFKPLQAVQREQLHLKGETCSFYVGLRRGEAKLPSEWHDTEKPSAQISAAQLHVKHKCPLSCTRWTEKADVLVGEVKEAVCFV